ncbi:hypothetical protein BJ741DRAFT_601192 [Chytriomyces cf. hyalinus JEL632]|nr:hypothetical protein BJ741DRAFT_601192 [Chytriomyces cf. hyalinus JEL632]
MTEPNIWDRYAQLSGQRAVRFHPAQSHPHPTATSATSDEGESSAHLYRSIIASTVPVTAHTNAQFLKRINRKKRQLDSSNAVSPTAEETEDASTTVSHSISSSASGSHCSLCETTIPTTQLDTHHTQTCHLMAAMEKEDNTQRPVIYAFSEKDTGYRMLQKHGWKHGDVLGNRETLQHPARSKLRAPIAPKIKRDQAGLGKAVKADSSLKVMKRVGDSFRAQIRDQVEAMAASKRGAGSAAVSVRTRSDILKEDKETRQKGIALLSYLNN